MEPNPLLRQLLLTFTGELDEHVQVLNTELLELERHPDEGRDVRVRELFRAAHTLKGAARAVNLQDIEAACHRMEELLSEARDHGQALDAATLRELFALVDVVAQGREALHARLASPPMATPEPAPSSGSEPGPVGRSLQVRVAQEKLDALLARASDLLLARRRLEAVEPELAQVRTELHAWQRRFRHLEGRLLSAAREAERAGEQAPVQLSRRVVNELLALGERGRSLERDSDRASAQWTANVQGIERASGPLVDQVRSLRMVSFEETVAGLDRVTRDVAKELGKSARLELTAGGVEVDRAVADGLLAALTQLIRNAVDHGIEAPARRLAAGKEEEGTVRLGARVVGDQVQVELSDDGDGLNRPALEASARARGLRVPSDEAGLAELIFQPGLSTKAEATAVSGRGVGLDVVRSRLSGLQGSVEVESHRGQGTRFLLTVPLTLSRLRALWVESGGLSYALPSGQVERLLRIPRGNIQSVEGREVISVSGTLVPLVPLRLLLGEEGASSPELDPQGKVSAVLLRHGERLLALAVDVLRDERETVVQGLGERVRQLPRVMGAAALPSGQPALLLNVPVLVQDGLAVPGAARLAAPPPAARPAKKRILLADDSVTTRALERNILESAGYEVRVAADGAQAWELLQAHGADAIVADVEMPRMDGIGLVKTVRESRRFATLPVVLVTGLGKDQDKARGLQAGASAYLVKTQFEQESLLRTLEQLL